MAFRRLAVAGLIGAAAVFAGVATVAAQQQRQPSLVEHYIDVQVEPDDPYAEVARFLAIHDQSNGVVCYTLVIPGAQLQCFK
jgi:cephalosporin-C deacetylase-like acetyl esterase